MKLSWARRVIGGVVVLIIASYVFWMWRPGYTVPILTYHSINYEDSLISVKPENFDRQLAYLKNKGYAVISLDELVEGIKNKKRFNHNTVVITFDDGRKDNYTHALPVLVQYDFPVTIFLASNLVNNNPGFMTWEEARAMMQHNVSFGAHTRNHAFLASMGSDDKLRDEIGGSKRTIEEKTGAPVDYFSYPHGAFNQNVRSIVQASGFKGACTTNIGPGRFNEDIYALKRIRVKNSDMNKPLSFWAKLSGYYNLFRRPRLEVEP